MRERLLLLFGKVMTKMPSNKDCGNLNHFDIPFNVVVGKILSYMGSL